MKRFYNPAEKAKIVLEVLRGEETINEIALQHDIHPTVLPRWKTHVIKTLPQLFENEATKTRRQAKESEKEKAELYQQIGKLTAQIEWLKKKSGY